MTGYTVDSILHSGRRGERYSICEDFKYKGLLGYKVMLDPYSLKAGKSVHMIVLDSPEYDWWDTTMVVAATVDTDANKLFIETVNTIYVLSEIEGQVQAVMKIPEEVLT